MYESYSPLVIVKQKTRGAFRQMLVIGLVLAVLLFAFNGELKPLAAFSSLLLGVVLSPVVWLIYRFGRFVFIG